MAGSTYSKISSTTGGTGGVTEIFIQYGLNGYRFGPLALLSINSSAGYYQNLTLLSLPVAVTTGTYLQLWGQFTGSALTVLDQGNFIGATRTA